MKRKIFIIPLLFYAIQAQVSISDINQIGNQKLDDLKEELIFQQNALQESEKVNDVDKFHISFTHIFIRILFLRIIDFTKFKNFRPI